VLEHRAALVEPRDNVWTLPRREVYRRPRVSEDRFPVFYAMGDALDRSEIAGGVTGLSSVALAELLIESIASPTDHEEADDAPNESAPVGLIASGSAAIRVSKKSIPRKGGKEEEDDDDEEKEPPAVGAAGGGGGGRSRDDLERTLRRLLPPPDHGMFTRSRRLLTVADDLFTYMRDASKDPALHAELDGAINRRFPPINPRFFHVQTLAACKKYTEPPGTGFRKPHIGGR